MANSYRVKETARLAAVSVRNFDKHREGLAVFLSSAIRANAARN